MKTVMMKCALSAAMLLLLYLPASAQWTQTNGPASGDVNALAVIGTNLFAASKSNGVFVSTDNAAHWSAANAGLLNTTVFALAASGADLFAGTERGVFLSSNNGATWALLANGLPVQAVRAVASSGGTILAGTDTGGVFSSIDNGAHWRAVNNGLANRNIRALAIGSAEWFAATAGGGVFRTDDDGVSWTAVNAGITDLNVNALYADGTGLYAGTNGGGVYVSNDHGVTWTPINAGIASSVSVRAITSLGGTLFAGTVGMGVYRSTDGGASWTLAQNGLPKINTLCFASIGTTLFAGILGGGVFRSTDLAGSWTATSSGLTTSIVLALASNGQTLFSGLFRNHCYTTADQGATWTMASTGLVSVSVMALATSGSTVYAGSDNGAFYTTTNGASWTAINNGLSPLYVSALAVRGQTLYAGTSIGVSVSYNGGASWMPAGAGIPPNTYIYSLLATDSAVFAGTLGAGVYRSRDNGASWSAVNLGLPSSPYVQAMAASGSVLFAGTNAGVFRSSNNGNSWTEMSMGLTNTFIRALVVNGTSMYAGTDGGIFVSENDGETWTGLNTGLTNQTVNALWVSGSDLYAGTAGSGVLRLGVGPLPTFTISGTTAIGGTTLSWTDTTAKSIVTDGAGNYSLRVSNNWSGVVTPSRDGYAFSPRSISYRNVRADFVAQNYAPSVLYAITGNAGTPNATFTWTDDTVRTATANAAGAFTINVPAHWSGTVTPSKPGYLFYPEQRSYSNITANVSGQTYSAWRGVMIAGNAGAPGVTMSWSDGGQRSTVSDSEGNYVVTVSYSYWGTVTPSLAGCTFTPASRYYSGQRTDALNNDYMATGSVTANIKVCLAGAYTGTAMSTALAQSGALPLNSADAYSPSAYGYTAKTVASIPGSAIVDWVLVELRRTTAASSRAGIEAGFLKSDGTIVDTDGTSQLAFAGVVPGPYYIVIHHRNHCAVMSAARATLATPSALYDFTVSITSAYGVNAMDALAGGVYGMFAGDANRDNAVTGSDYNIFSQRYAAIAQGYEDADMNLDGLVTGTDFNIFSPNYVAIRASQVPQ